MKHFKVMNFLLFILGISFLLAACSSEPVQGTLTRQDFGTANQDTALDVAAPKGGVGAVVVGLTNGALDGVNKGGFDAFIRKYDGGVVWAQQFGTRGTDFARDVAVTNTGISYVVGETDGALGFKVGGRDVFLRKYDANGVVQWTRQFGTTGFDDSRDVALDSSGNVYVLSRDSDSKFRIRKFNASGTLLLTITNTTVGVFPAALAVDSTGTIFVLTQFAPSSTQFARLFKYNSAGTLVASPNVFAAVSFITPTDLIVDSSNNLYFSVRDSGLNRGAFVRKVNNVGVILWTQRIEPAATGAVSFPNALALDAQGNVNVTGPTTGAYPGFTNAGSTDIFVLQLAGTTGARFWTRQIGGNSVDTGFGIAVSDSVYVAGDSLSNPNLLGDPAYGANDAFLAQFDRATGAVLGIDQ
jgi:Beta-propeller repeat